MSEQSQPFLTITEAALEKILEIRDQEATEEEYVLRIEITGIRGNDFSYELAFEPFEDVGPDDVLQRYGELGVVAARASARDLEGATLDLSRDLMSGGLVIDNPNRPSPAIGGSAGELTGPTAEKVAQLLERQINPAVAMHGGGAELVGVEEETVFIRLHGGCQGCGMAQVTLQQGIEQAIFQAIPEVKRVVDVTDHASGTDPYYEPSK